MKMRNMPLALQIWLLIACVTSGIFLLISLLLPSVISGFFTREIHAAIETEQQRIIHLSGDSLQEDPSSPIEKDQDSQDQRAVRSFLILQDGRTLPAAVRIPNKLLTKIQAQTSEQSAATTRYTLRIGEDRLFYIARKINYRNRQVHLVSYMWDTYYRDLTKALNRKLIKLTAITAIVSLLPALLMARRVSRPLVRLEQFVERIADRHWNEPLLLDRKDEIGRLAHSIDKMREQLKRQDEYQQTMLQHISHELKTPVMVIRSYTQSIQDGIFPQGDLGKSLGIIDNESARLEKRIRDLLYLTKLDYMAFRKPDREIIDMPTLVESVLERLRWRNPRLVFDLHLESAAAKGDPEQWTVAIENMLDNQIRYAASRILIRVETARGNKGDSLDSVLLTFGNDGPPLPQGMDEELFHPFRTGPKGQFGLGMAIVRKVAELHDAQVSALNTPEGVRFFIRIPASSSSFF